MVKQGGLNPQKTEILMVACGDSEQKNGEK
jgi:hypothetical protein